MGLRSLLSISSSRRITGSVVFIFTAKYVTRTSRSNFSTGIAEIGPLSEYRRLVEQEKLKRDENQYRTILKVMLFPLTLKLCSYL
jgi:hypothetical protein